AYTPPLKEHGLDGNNNWVISGDRTTSGFPYMASDPHRAVTLPSLRYMVHLNAPGWNVIGGGEPVIPGVSIGHNDHGAWGLTIFETDAEDLYVYELNPENLGQYKHKGKWVDMQEIEELIPIKGEKPRKVTLRYTLHGPVTYIDSTRQRAFAVRCGWLETGGAPYLASLRINQAKNWRQFRKANTYNHLPGENMIWADRKGHIGWQVVGIAPIRKNSSGMVPVPGDGRYEWSGYLPIRKRPHVKNPAKGFFATANEHVTPETYKHWNTIAFSWADPFRGRRIHEVLSEKKLRSLADEVALQADFYSIPARTLIPMLDQVDLKSELAKTAHAQLDGWDFFLSPESVAAGIYAMWERIIYRESNRRFIPEQIRPHISLQLSRIIQWLEQPNDKFGANYERGRAEFLVETFEMAVNALEEKLGNSVEKWHYGQENYKHSRMQHPLNHLLPENLQEKYALGPLPRGGNSHSPNATGGSDNQASGASFRIITDLSDWDKALMINSPGQSADPESKYYGNLFELWAKDEFFPAYFSREKIEAHTDVKTILNPRP
ncbi:MAG TPA: penicillin acylase family protein, partial [Sphingobacteriaceae bacterium]|nr:penicillin acylase family protein [Sphingobacteriaceae bacterium]